VDAGELKETRMFKKILIANRGDKRRLAPLAVEAHAGAACVMLEPKRVVHEVGASDLAPMEMTHV
jgi:hypothetical protein